MAELINRDDSLNQGRVKLNEGIKASERAENKSDEALGKANQSLSQSESTLEQLNQVVLDGDSSVEAAQARVNADNTTTYDTLKDRLDAEHTEVNAQLEKTVKRDETGVLNLNVFDEPTRNILQGQEPGQINAVLGKENIKEFNIATETITMHKTDFVNISRYKNVYGGIEISGGLGVAVGNDASRDGYNRTNYINTGIYDGGFVYIINAWGARNFVFSYRNKNDQEGTLLNPLIVKEGYVFRVELPPGEPYIRFITLSPDWSRTGEIEVWSGGNDNIGGIKLNETFEFRKNANLAELVNYNLGWNVGTVGEPFNNPRQKTTEHIPVEAGDVIEIKIKEKDPYEHADTSNRIFRYAFYTEPKYDGDGEFLVHRSTTQNEEVALTVPEGAKFFALSNYFRDLLDIRIKKKGQESIPEEPTQQTKQYFNNLLQVFPKYTTIGDSLTAGFTSVNGNTTGSTIAVQTKNNWPGFLELRTGREFNNIAVGGSTVKDWRDTHLVTAEAETDAYIVALGVNDARQGLAVGTADDINADRTLNANSFYGNYDYLVREIKEYNLNAHVFLFTIPPHESNAETYNPTIRHIANLYEKVHLIDMHNLYYDEYTSGFLPNGWVGGHYTPMTYNYHSSLIEEALNKYIYNNGDKFIAVPYE